MKLPEKIKVAAFDIKLEEYHPHEATDRRQFGEFSALQMRICYDPTIDKIKIVDTLFHEIGHAIYWAYGLEDEDKEERIVGTFATGWTQVFRDNPQLYHALDDLLFLSVRNSQLGHKE